MTRLLAGLSAGVRRDLTWSVQEETVLLLSPGRADEPVFFPTVVTVFQSNVSGGWGFFFFYASLLFVSVSCVCFPKVKS